MKKELHEIDPVYKEVTGYMTVADRISYCQSLIQETRYFMGVSMGKLDKKTRAKYDELINAATAEIEKLSDGHHLK